MRFGTAHDKTLRFLRLFGVPGAHASAFPGARRQPRDLGRLTEGDKDNGAFTRDFFIHHPSFSVPPTPHSAPRIVLSIPGSDLV